MSTPLVGGLSDTVEADDLIQLFCDQIKSLAEDMTKKTYEEFRAVKYIEQIVAGKHYFIKVHVGEDDYLHVKVFIGLTSPENLVLSDVMTGMKEDDPIKFF